MVIWCLALNSELYEIVSMKACLEVRLGGEHFSIMVGLMVLRGYVLSERVSGKGWGLELEAEGLDAGWVLMVTFLHYFL